ncbi:MAG: AAA family ATPase [Pseudomonadota bacterium]
MKNNFINHIGIENFKCFQNLTIDGLESVNLIGGKNNVGKTAFLEAVELLVSSNETYDLVINIYKLLTRRQTNNLSNDILLDFIREDETKVKIYTKNKNLRLVVQDEHYEIKDIIPTTKLSYAINEDEKSLAIDRLLGHSMQMRDRHLNIDNINFISSAKAQEQDIAILYGSLVDLDREYFLNDSLRIFDDNIISIKQRATKNNVILKLKLKDRQMPVLLSSLGEGINRYIAVLCAIWASKDGFLLIDEIENGIHYTNYKKLWQIIFQASADANCQLFITSHSKECIEAFNDVQLEEENNRGAYFEFYKNIKTDMITASKRHKEQLKYSLTHQGRVRGE